MQQKIRTVPVLDLLLNRENPRHEPKTGQQEIIEYLLADEEVYNLARHMSVHGINPLEVSAVFPDQDGNLVVAEGNRRICAAQLLTDPEKVPQSRRARFRKLSAEKGVDVSRTSVMEFPDYESARPWLQVLHDGEQDGIGRRRWKPEQKARATTNASTNSLAVALTDYAERQGIIDGDAKKKLLISTVTRYLANPGVRRAMGLASQTSSNKVIINTDRDRFNQILGDFYEGVATQRLHSRSKTPDWNSYAQHLEATFKAPASTSKATDVTIMGPIKSKGSRRTKVRILPPDTRYIGRSPSIAAALNQLGSYKMSSLYHSLTELRLDEHPALMTAGAWVFLESLTALHGCTTEFVGYIAGKYGGWGFTRDQWRDFKLSLEYIQGHGNAQKHSPTFST